ncbi:DUF4350 domain-containing protein [Streptomyces sp. NPDC001941]|uniref:DUF4350 domain-containing protein n=1 Tax=Streptomyces sp. NPDC001941 TaxID=3154659 RepID=UPI003329D874
MTTTSIALTPQQVWTRFRGILIVLVIIVAAGITLAALRSGDSHGRLDSRSADRSGSRAVAELLKAQGVDTRVVTTLDEAVRATGPDSTLLVATPDLLTTHQQETLRTSTASAGGRTVLVAPGQPSVGTLLPGVRANSDTASISTLRPQCTLPAAERAGSVDLGGERYATDLPDAIGCYPSDGLPTLLHVPGTGRSDTVLIGSADILYNEHLAQQGNASLTLQLLGSRTHLVWYLPSLGDDSALSEDDSENTAFLDLIPSGWRWATLQLLLAAALAAIWRARRLGPLVTERLPVAVRASEATEGRARLYRKAGARDRAAAVLRSATRARLAPLLGVAPADAHSPAVLLPATAARLASTDRDPTSLLFGPAPTDDAELTRLADQLDALEREVRTS